MPPKRKVPNSYTDTVIAEVMSRSFLWNEKDDNFGNDYATDKGWDEIALKLDCTSTAVKDKWLELCNSHKKIARQKPKLTSGSAGGEISRKDTDLETDGLSFIKNKQARSANVTGNLDALVDDTLEKVVTKDSKKLESNTQKEGEKDDSLAMLMRTTDENFFSSMLPTISSLNDEAKLYFRIEIMDLLSVFAEKLDLSDVEDDDEIQILGEWRPVDPTAQKRSVKKEH